MPRPNFLDLFQCDTPVALEYLNILAGHVVPIECLGLAKERLLVEDCADESADVLHSLVK